ncbi:hypothetical protein C4546_02065 [Candidatus Parcubacteria bacterium]|jgi:hypothetical protein|nr:MAG: hypothetical protein C4546_02065 [Candidatus Parcubacteria bacterium]
MSKWLIKPWIILALYGAFALFGLSVLSQPANSITDLSESEPVTIISKNSNIAKVLPSQNSIQPLTNCKDFDNGQNVYVRSAVMSAVEDQSENFYLDKCVTSGTASSLEYYSKLQEYSCVNQQMVSRIIDCPYGCISGACRPAPTKGTVYVVHAVDTERAAFNPRVYSNDLSSSDFGPGSNVDYVFGQTYRNANKDSFGGSIKLSWFLMNHEGYCRSQQGDCNSVNTAIKPYANKITGYDDALGWHFHLSDWTDINNDDVFFWNQLLTFNSTFYEHGTDIQLAEKMLASQILDQQFFPAMYRSGWGWENNDYSNWLEDIFPFDLTNLSPGYGLQTLADGIGNVYNWHDAPADWSWYHPSPTNYQQPGSQKRIMFRCGGDVSDMIQAFAKANQGQDVMICTYNHNYFPYFGQYSLLTTLNFIKQWYYPDIKFKFVNAMEGIRIMLNLFDEEPPVAELIRVGNTYTLQTNEQLYAYPYGAIKDSNGNYWRVKPIQSVPDLAGGKYSWTFNLEGRNYVEFAAAGSDKSGNTFVTQKLTNKF